MWSVPRQKLDSGQELVRNLFVDAIELFVDVLDSLHLVRQQHEISRLGGSRTFVEEGIMLMGCDNR